MIKNVGIIGYGYFGKKTYKEVNKFFKKKNIFILTKTKKRGNLNFYYNENHFFKKKIDFYFVCSPIDTHFFFLKKLIKKKKKFLIEKPIISSVKEFNSLKKNINLNKEILVNYIDKFNPSFKLFLNNIRNKKNLESINIEIGKYQNIYKNVKLNFSNIHKLPFFDWLPHPIALIFEIFGKEPKIQNIKNKFIKKNNLIFQNLDITLKINKNLLNISFSNYKKKQIRKISAIYKNYILVYSSYSNNKISSVAESNATFKKIKRSNKKTLYYYKNKKSNLFYSIEKALKNNFKDTVSNNLKIMKLIFKIGKKIF